MKPTVINFGEPQNVKPTSIQPTSLKVPTINNMTTEKNMTIKPTSLGGLGASTQPVLQPSSVSVTTPAFQTSTTPSVAPTPSVSVTAPTFQAPAPIQIDNASMVPGTQNKSLDVHFKDLELRYFGFEHDHYARAAVIVRTITPKTTTARQIALFGDTLQHDIARFMDDMMAWSQHPSYADASTYASRMSIILSDVIRDFQEYGKGLLSRFKDNPVETWNKHLPELDRLIKSIEQLVPHMENQYDELETFVDNGREFFNEISAHIIAAHFASDSIDEHKIAYYDKMQSFTQQKLLIVASIQQGEIMMKQTRQWIQRIKDLRRTSYPHMCQIMSSFNKNFDETFRHQGVSAANSMLQDLT